MKKLKGVVPPMITPFDKEGMKGDMESCRITQFRVNRLREIMYFVKSTQLAVYAMLQIRGVIEAFPRSPFVPAGESEKAEIQRALAEMEMI